MDSFSKINLKKYSSVNYTSKLINKLINKICLTSDGKRFDIPVNFTTHRYISTVST